MRLRNRREPYNEVEENNQGLIDWYLMHDYEAVESAPEYPVVIGKRNKKDAPPADLSALASELSEDHD